MGSVYLLKKPKTTEHYINFVFGSGLVTSGQKKNKENYVLLHGIFLNETESTNIFAHFPSRIFIKQRNEE